MSNEEVWYNNLNKLEEFIKNNNRRPFERKNDEKYLGTWINSQTQNYKNKLNIMKNKQI